MTSSVTDHPTLLVRTRRAARARETVLTAYEMEVFHYEPIKLTRNQDTGKSEWKATSYPNARVPNELQRGSVTVSAAEAFRALERAKRIRYISRCGWVICR